MVVTGDIRDRFDDAPQKLNALLTYLLTYLLVRPETIVFGRTYVLAQMFFFCQREISEMRGPTGVKFCTVVSTRPNFIMPVQNFGGHTLKNLRGQKHAKFGPISDDFEVRRRISPKRMNIFKIGFLFRLSRCLPRQAKQVR